ncbi:MAG: TIGR00725 family protein [Elusimicrobiota bacterium]
MNNNNPEFEEFSNKNRSKKIVGVIGGARVEKEIYSLARELGRKIAASGHILVCGGLGGVMEAACRGAHESGGITVGILPGNSAATANPYVTIPVVTAMSHARNAIIVRTADILVAVDGKYGTLSEIALAKAIGKRVIGLYTWDEVPGVEAVDSVEEALAEINAT